MRGGAIVISIALARPYGWLSRRHRRWMRMRCNVGHLSTSSFFGGLRRRRCGSCSPPVVSWSSNQAQSSSRKLPLGPLALAERRHQALFRPDDAHQTLHAKGLVIFFGMIHRIPMGENSLLWGGLSIGNACQMESKTIQRARARREMPWPEIAEHGKTCRV
jgi:hypothetical protein